MEVPQIPVSTLQTSSRDSRSSSLSSRAGSNLSLDLSSVPPLIEPSPPTNTLLITNLKNLEIFTPSHLSNLRDLINNTATIISWSPLKSFRRIVTSFQSEEDALRIRQLLDGESIMGERIRIYFGQHTPVQPVDQHLAAPESKKLFFISPPPSPPQGWESRNEEPPNTMVMAEDLAEALKRLDWNVAKLDSEGDDSNTEDKKLSRRQRSGSSTVLFEPEINAKGNMPGITVDDFSDEEQEISPVTGLSPIIPIANMHTARPPLETMNAI